jgi:hypothetical protein
MFGLATDSPNPFSHKPVGFHSPSSTIVSKAESAAEKFAGSSQLLYIVRAVYDYFV